MVRDPRDRARGKQAAIGAPRKMWPCSRFVEGRIGMRAFVRRVLAALEKFLTLVGIGGAVPGPGPHTRWPGGK